MKALSELDPRLAGELVCLFTDIDETVSTAGKITARAYSALWRAQEAGLAVVPVTGRPAGWCDHIARMWPVHGVIGENGDLVFRMEEGGMRRSFLYDAETRATFRRRLEELRARIREEIPAAGIASDQSYREYDLAVDFCEDVPALPREQVLRIKRIFEEHGATAKISSIHVNGWNGEFDKLSAAKSYMREFFDLDPDRDRDRCAFAGDSPNDEPMFRWFVRSSFGVANLRRFENLVDTMPAYICSLESGAGFAELVETILNLRIPR